MFRLRKNVRYATSPSYPRRWVSTGVGVFTSSTLNSYGGVDRRAEERLIVYNHALTICGRHLPRHISHFRAESEDTRYHAE